MSRFSMISPLYNKRIGLNDGPSPIALYVLAIKDPKSAIASTGFFLIFLKTCKKMKKKFFFQKFDFLHKLLLQLKWYEVTWSEI